jgi:hypothetical protein
MQNLVNRKKVGVVVMLMYVVRQKVDWRRTCYFDTRMHQKLPEVHEFINLFSICACSTLQYDTDEEEKPQ